MALQRRKILKQMLNLGYGTDTVPDDSGGSRTGDKLGIHTFLGDGFFSVKDFGATGDGTADDTSAINAAYTELPSVGGTLFFPKGTYKITSQLDWSDSKCVVVMGAGQGASIIRVSGAAKGSSPYYGAIKLSKASAGMKTLKDFTIQRASAGALANDNGIVFGPVQNIVNIERLTIENMGNDGILHRGDSASVNVHRCNIRNNSGYGINGTGAADAIQNFVIDSCSIYGNAGGVAIVNNYKTTLSNNDIEGDGGGVTQSLPMLNITGSGVSLENNTVSLSAGASATVVGVFNGENIISEGDQFSIGAAGQTALQIGASARNARVIAPQLSAPASPGGVGVEVVALASNTLIDGPNFGNTFTTRISDSGTGTTVVSRTTDAKVSLYQNLTWGNGKGELATDGHIEFNIDGNGLANGAGDLTLRAKAATGSVKIQDANGSLMLTVSVANGVITHRNGCTDGDCVGTPEGAITAPKGSTRRRTDGGANTSFYVKESGSGNTGWVAK